MPYSVKGFFEIDEDMVQILLVLEVLFTQDSEVEDLFCGASSGSEPSLFFSNYFFSLGFKPIQDNVKHDFAWMTDEADSSVVLAELQAALLGSVIISDWVHGVGHSPVLQILLQIPVKTSIMVSTPAWTSSAGILSTPADFPFFSGCYCNLNFLTEDWLQIFFRGLAAVQYSVVSTTLIVVQFWAIFCPSAENLFFFSKTFPILVLDSWGPTLFLWG